VDNKILWIVRHQTYQPIVDLNHGFRVSNSGEHGGKQNRNDIVGVGKIVVYVFIQAARRSEEEVLEGLKEMSKFIKTHRARIHSSDVWRIVGSGDSTHSLSSAKILFVVV